MFGKRISSLLGKITVLLVICCCCLPAHAKYGGGTGEPNDPYLIFTSEQMNAIGADSNDWDKHFLLCADIDLSAYTESSFNIIGTSPWPTFTGVFDGNGHTISNFTYTSTGINYIGLFGYVSGIHAEIKELGLIDPDVDAGTGNNVGSLIGYNSGSITHCYVKGGSVSVDCFTWEGGNNVGSLVGFNIGNITNCFADGGSVSGNDAVGGLVGVSYYDQMMARYGIVANCYSTSEIHSEYGFYVGGLVGANYGTIINCYSMGSVSGLFDVGGLVGWNHQNGTNTSCCSTGSVAGDSFVGGLVGSNSGTITNCYSTGSVSGYSSVGGLVGLNGTIWVEGVITNSYSAGKVSGGYNLGGLVGYRPGYVVNSFWDIKTSGQTSSAGGTGKTTAELQMMSTFTDAAWDFLGETVNGIDDIWFIPQHDYPHLWWEGMKVPMKMTPVSLNCRSEGNWVKAHITLPEGFTVADVNSNRSAVLHSFGFQSTPLYVFVNKDKLVEIEAAFEREQICSLAGNWPDELTVAGFLADGNIFLGTSNVRIIHPGMKVIEELASCWLQGDCIYPETDMNRDSLVNMLDYALLMNINIEFVTYE